MNKRMTAGGLISVFLVLIVLVASLLLTGCFPAEEDVVNQEIPRNVRVLELAPEGMEEFFEVTGPIEPVSGSDLSAQESGPIVALVKNKGQAVEKGQLIIEQDRTILKAEMQSAEAALNTQEYNVDKVRQLFDAGKVSRIELLTAESLYQQARSAAEVTKERYRRAGISAPFDGVVVDRYVELGQLVAPGMPVVRLLDPYTLKMTCYLTDRQVQWLAVGDPATVRLGENRDLASGVVSWIAFEADRMTGKFKVEVQIPNDDLQYHSGVIGRARLPKNSIDDVVIIPRDAIMPSRYGSTVFVVEGERAYQRQVDLGQDQGLMVVVESGLNPGEKLVVRGHRELRDGNLVAITEISTAADGSLPADPSEVTAAESGSRIQTKGQDGVQAVTEAAQ